MQIKQQYKYLDLQPSSKNEQLNQSIFIIQANISQLYETSKSMNLASTLCSSMLRNVLDIYHLAIYSYLKFKVKARFCLCMKILRMPIIKEIHQMVLII